MRMPTVFWNHGGGPFPVLGHPSQAPITKYLQGLAARLPTPKAIIVATAHWEEPVITVSTASKPGMLYDYHGFPPEAYQLRYDAPGAPEVANKVLALLRSAGIACAEDTARGYDHGTFVPLMLAYPDATIPVVQVSLQAQMDPLHHMRVGQALAPLRDQGVLIVGSGMSFHNMQVLLGGGFGNRPGAAYGPNEAFDTWLQGAVVGARGDERMQRLAGWADAPGGRQSHPREEHLVPLFVAAGAALDDEARADMSAPMMGVKVTGFVFGA